MLGTVGSTVQSNALAQPGSGRANVSASSGDEGVREPVQAPFISPYISFDNSSKTAVLAIRNPDTGEIIRTIPSEGKLEADQRQEQDQQSEAALESLAVQEGAESRAAPADKGFDVAFIQEQRQVQNTAPVQTQASAPAPQPSIEIAAFQSASQASGADASVTVLA